MECDASDCGPPDPAGQAGTRKGARLYRGRRTCGSHTEVDQAAEGAARSQRAQRAFRAKESGSTQQHHEGDRGDQPERDVAPARAARFGHADFRDRSFG